MKMAARAALIIVLLSATGIMKAYAYDFSAVCSSGQTLYYNITDATNHYVAVTYRTTSYDSYIGDVVVPQTVINPNDNEVYTVSAVGASAFRRSSTTGSAGRVTSVSLPSTVNSIGDYAFYNGYTYLTSVNIPDAVFSIGKYAFYYCRGLTSLNLGTGVRTIYERAFSGCSGLTTLTIPDNVMYIYDYAFQSCSSLETVNFNASNCSYQNLLFNNYFDSAWNGCSHSCTLNIGDNVTSLPRYAFKGFKGLTTINWGSGLTATGMNAFEGCTGLTALALLSIPANITTISDYSFYGCTGLTSIDIPDHVTSIGSYAFYGCSGAASLAIGTGVASVGTYAFYGCSGLVSLDLGTGVRTIRERAFSGCSGLTTLTIPDNVMYIYDYAFQSCSGLETVNFNASNCSYHNVPTSNYFDSAWNGCSHSCTLNIGDNVTSLPRYAFKGFKGLTTINWGSGLTATGMNAFEGCTGLTALALLSIPANITTISDYSFYGCTGLTSIDIPDHVTSIGSYAFYGCSLSDVTMMRTTAPTLGTSAFHTNNGTISSSLSIYVPVASINNYKTAANWNTYADHIKGWMATSIAGYGTGNDKWAFIASPLTTENLAPTAIENMIPSNDNYDLYRFNQSAAMEWENWKSHANNDNHYHFNLENGQGYLYANAEDVNLIFKGAFNEDETKDVELVYDEGKPLSGWNLVGNPFPMEATVTGRSYYVMNEAGTGINPEAVSTGGTIEACTGIVVKAESTETNPTVTFSKVSRQAISNNGLLQIAVANTSSRNNVIEDMAVLSFNEGDQLGKFYFGHNSVNIYFPQGIEEYAIISAEAQGEMPLNFVANENGQYTISVNPENVEMNYLHLVDNMTGANVDLLVEPEYTFAAKTTDYPCRFRLVFSSICENADDDDEAFAYYNGSEWVIDGDGTLQVVDGMGRILFNGDAKHGVSTHGMAPGVYVLCLTQGDKVRTQKMVVR